MKQTNKIRRESHSGFHFFNLFQNCPRKFFIKYILRITTETTGSPLIFGAAFHEGKAVWYETGNKNKALSTAQFEVDDRKSEYEKYEEYERDSKKISILLDRWIEKFGRQDLKVFKFEAVEKQVEVEIPHTSGFKMTIRPDAIVTNTDGESFVLETKTSGFSPYVADKGVYYGDQATSYLYGAKKSYPNLNIQGVLPDIAYWNKKTFNEENITFMRGDLIYRNNRNLEEFALGVANVVTTISQSAKAYFDGKAPAAMLFPRNTSWCLSFSRPCEYADICRTNLETLRDDELPVSFKRDNDWENLGLKNI